MERLAFGLELKFAKDAQVGTFTGYGSTFGGIDRGGDMVAPGAFRNSLSRLKAMGLQPPMYIMHGPALGFDPRPVGVWTKVEEDAKGLAVDGKLVGMDTDAGKYNYALLKEGALPGLSIGYRATKVDYGKKPGDPRRTIKELDLVEISLVSSPMDPKSQVQAVKAIEEFQKLGDVERYLRESCGLSRSEAVALVSRIKSLGQSDSAGGDLGALLEKAERNISILKP